MIDPVESSIVRNPVCDGGRARSSVFLVRPRFSVWKVQACDSLLFRLVDLRPSSPWYVYMLIKKRAWFRTAS